jgi:serine protease inhibitor
MFVSQGKKYSMFIVLPNKPDGLNKLLNTVSPALLRNQLFHMDKALVNVRLPKFSFDFTAKLEDTLQAVSAKLHETELEGKQHSYTRESQ